MSEMSQEQGGAREKDAKGVLKERGQTSEISQEQGGAREKDKIGMLNERGQLSDSEDEMEEGGAVGGSFTVVKNGRKK